MPVTLDQLQQDVTDATDFTIIDYFRRSSWLFDNMTFEGTISGNARGASMRHSWWMLTKTMGASNRALNAEGTPSRVEKEELSTVIQMINAQFQIDRISKEIADGAEYDLHNEEAAKAVIQFFIYQAINGQGEATSETAQLTGHARQMKSAFQGSGFDGLLRLVQGTDTYLDVSAEAGANWVAASGASSNNGLSIQATSLLDDATDAMRSNSPDVWLGNRDAIRRIRTLAKFQSQLGTLEAFGRSVETYAGVPFVDLGDYVDTNGGEHQIIPTDEDGLTKVIGVKLGLDGFHGITLADEGQLIRRYEPDFSAPGAVKTSEVELVAAPILKNRYAAVVLDGIKVK